MLSSKDIFLSRLDRDVQGRLPIFLRDLTLGLDVIGARTTDVFMNGYDHDLSAKAVVGFQRYSEQDAVVGCIQSAAFNVESFGGTMKYPEYGIPIPLTHPFADITEVPRTVELSPRSEGAIRSYSIVRDKLPDVAVVANVEGPLTKSGTLLGMEFMSMLIASDDELLDDVIEVSEEHTMMFIEELHKNSSIDSVFFASATDNPDLFGPDVYDDLVLKNQKRLTERVHKIGYPVIFHPHGVFSSTDRKEMFERTLHTGIDGFQFAESNDPSVISSWIDGRCAILGGTDIVPTLLNGTEEQIRSETEFYLRSCNEPYIFMPSCSLHRGSDLDRISIMLDAVKNNKNIKVE